ncbi:uncharacterized protein AMSG_07668 [Thecamonas trahens ATCC 50062]|uniref:Integral membrane protein n=1 Tax=Thecamonas trahens ATCC 50062 TaxID=461836 RepID=A0A0L0DGL5_THETB|nr:integral membrane protein [Thecamonas trahens ATCC 50062]KNC51472.1 integral membrane protein [Thecamonas trahens ATCC 50062]|eukprot:XP_013756134.1 integral membrane protein [Thecamonas trahens ATCC 50062]
MSKYRRNACPVSCVKHLFVFINLIFLIVGLAVIGAGVHLSKKGSAVPKNHSGPNVYDYSKHIATALYIIGSLISLVSFLGCCGAWKRIKALLCCYWMLVFLLIAAQVAIGVVVYHAAKDNKLDDHLADSWSSSDNAWKNSVQENFHCCGYNSPTDDPGSVCPGSTADDPNAGCRAVLKDDLQKALHVIVIVALVLAALELFGLLASMILMCCLNTELKDPAGVGLLNSRQPQPAYRPTYSTRTYQ